MIALAIPFAGALSVALTLLHVIICVFLVFVVLLQRGRSQDLASAFGGGQTQANLAAMSTDDFLTRATKISAFMFMGTSLALALFAQARSSSVLDTVPGNDKPVVEDEAGATGETGATAESAPATSAAPVPIEITPVETVPVDVVPAPAPSDQPPPAEPPGASGP